MLCNVMMCMFICLYSVSSRLCSENGYAEGRTDPHPHLIEVQSVPLETIWWGKMYCKQTWFREKYEGKHKNKINHKQ